MKLRLRENSIRLRLLQSEVNKLRDTGNVSETITFGVKPDEQFIYLVRVSDAIQEIHARIQNNVVEINIPITSAAAWINNEDEVGIYAVQKLSAEIELSITIEKDYACPTRPADLDNRDAFPNPDNEC